MHIWIVNDIYNFTKIAAILIFHVNMPPYWILCVFGPFLMPHILRKKSYIKRNYSVYQLYHLYSIQNVFFA